MYNLPYVLGVLCGAGTGIAAALIFRVLYKRKHGTAPCEYDERQEWARGKAYQYGYYTMLLCVLAGAIWREITGSPLFDSISGAFLLILPGLLVFIVCCIWKEAYVSRYEKQRRMIVGFVLLGVVNLLCAGKDFLETHTFLENGRLGGGSLNLLCGVMLLIVVATMLVRRLTLREESEEDS